MRCTVHATRTEHKAMDFTNGARMGSFVAISSQTGPERALCVCGEWAGRWARAGTIRPPPPPARGALKLCKCSKSWELDEIIMSIPQMQCQVCESELEGVCRMHALAPPMQSDGINDGKAAVVEAANDGKCAKEYSTQPSWFVFYQH